MATVRDIIDGVRHRLPDRVNLYPALNRAVRIISKRLFLHQSELVIKALSVEVSSGSTADLPADFWAMYERPNISGKTWFLKPVPDDQTRLIYTSNAVPEFYEILGLVMHLYPGTSSAITIQGRYWYKPTALTGPDDTVPYNELFDDVIQEALIQIYGTGSSVALNEMIYQSVDSVVPFIGTVKTKRIQDTVGLDNYTNDEWSL